METALSLADLRKLARLYRDGVGGAHDQLAEVIARSSESLPDVVGFSRANLERLQRSDDPVELLVLTLEAGLRSARSERNAKQKRAACALASALATSATWDGESVHLPMRALSDVVTTWPGRGVLMLGERGGVGIPWLRAFLRECRRVDDIDGDLTSDALTIRYRTSTSRGRVRLGLHPAHDGDDVLVVPLPVSAPIASVAIAPHAVVAPPSDDSARGPASRRTTTPAVRFAFRFIEAVAAMVGGAS